MVSPALYATPKATPFTRLSILFLSDSVSHSHKTVIGCPPQLDGKKVEAMNGREVKLAVDVLHDGNLKEEQDSNGYCPKPLGDASYNGGPEKIDGSGKPLTVDT